MGSHVFEWIADKEFFTNEEVSEIEDANINVHVTLIKHSHFLELDFLMEGWAEVICDRCLDPLRVDVNLDTKMYVKFGEGNDDIQESEDTDIIMLPYDEDVLDVSQYVYEYAHLSLPIRRVHPAGENGQSTCNEEMIQKLNQYLVKDTDDSADDPRWDDLMNIFAN